MIDEKKLIAEIREYIDEYKELDMQGGAQPEMVRHDGCVGVGRKPAQSRGVDTVFGEE